MNNILYLDKLAEEDKDIVETVYQEITNRCGLEPDVTPVATRNRPDGKAVVYQFKVADRTICSLSVGADTSTLIGYSKTRAPTDIFYIDEYPSTCDAFYDMFECISA